MRFHAMWDCQRVSSNTSKAPHTDLEQGHHGSARFPKIGGYALWHGHRGPKNHHQKEGSQEWP